MVRSFNPNATAPSTTANVGSFSTEIMKLNSWRFRMPANYQIGKTEIASGVLGIDKERLHAR